MRASDQTLTTLPIDEHGSVAWISFPGEWMQRASAAVMTAAGLVLVDPVDHHDLDERLAAVGRVVSVVRLLDRHGRDCAAVAARHGVEVVDRPLGEPWPGVRVVPVVSAPGWHESALWVADRGLLVVPEALGTAPYYRASADEALAVHPLLRLVPPRALARRLDGTVTTIAVGHGPPLVADAQAALSAALATARRRLPRAWIRAVRLARSQSTPSGST